MLICPRQDALAELRDLLPVAEHDGVLPDEIDAADVAVEIDADARPVEPRRDLLDVRRFSGAVITLDQHPPVVGEAGENRQRRVAVEAVGVVDDGDVLGAFAEPRHVEVAVEPEGLPHRDSYVRFVSRCGLGFGGHGLGHESGSLVRLDEVAAGNAGALEETGSGTPAIRRCDRVVADLLCPSLVGSRGRRNDSGTYTIRFSSRNLEGPGKSGPKVGCPRAPHAELDSTCRDNDASRIRGPGGCTKR